MAVEITWDDIPEKCDNSSNQISQGISLSGNHSLFISDNYPVLQGFVASAIKVNLIYIDPPYNTGNNFTYQDDFSCGGDRHSAWLSFMNRRLLLAKEILMEDGCIFIAIDQSELYVLKLLCDKIFGEENFVNDFMWLHGKGKKDSWSRTLQQHTLCYAKNKKKLRPFVEIEYSNWAKKNNDNDARGNWFSGSISFSEKRSNPNHKNFYSVTSPAGKIWTRQWLVSQKEMNSLMEENRIFLGKPPLFDKVPRLKIFNGTPTQVIPKNIIDGVESTRSAQNHLDKLLGQNGLFDNPKPVNLIMHLIEISRMPSDAVILDFFAGSGTTFEAVVELNKKDNGNRRCLLVQKEEKEIALICEKRINAVKGDLKVDVIRC